MKKNIVDIKIKRITYLNAIILIIFFIFRLFLDKKINSDLVGNIYIGMSIAVLFNIIYCLYIWKKSLKK